MRTLKFVSYTALAIFLFQVGLAISIPFSFPGDIVAWDIVISSSLLLATVCILLFMLPRFKQNNMPRIIFSLASLSMIFLILGWTPWIIAMFFLVALIGIYLVFSHL